MKILVGYDGTNASIEALNLSVIHAKAFKGEVLLLTSLLGGKNTSEDEIRTAKENLESAKRKLDRANIDGVEQLLIKGHTPAEDIIRFAEENNVDEIIIGVRRRSKVGKLIFGSNAREVILGASCPVVTVK